MQSSDFDAGWKALIQPGMWHDGAMDQVVSNDNIVHEGVLNKYLLDRYRIVGSVVGIFGSSSGIAANSSISYKVQFGTKCPMKSSKGGKHLGVRIDAFMCPCPRHCSSSLHSIHEGMQIFVLLSTYCALEPHLQQTLFIHPFTIHKLPQEFAVMLLDS